MLSKFATLLLLLGIVSPAYAEDKASIAKASLIADAPASQLENGEPVWVALELAIEDGWHVYWQNPGDSGMPTSITFELPDGATASPIHWPVPERQAMAGLVNYGYSNRVALPVAIHAPKGSTEVSLHAKANWLVCKDICIPESATLTINLPDISGSTAISQALFNVPAISKTGEPLPFVRSDNVLTISVPADEFDQAITAVDFFPITENLIQNASATRYVVNDGVITLTADAAADAPSKGSIEGVLRVTSASGTRAVQFSAKKASSKTTSESSPAPEHIVNEPDLSAITWWGAILFALLGGLLLNLMPCVLPILAMKAFGIVAKQHAPRKTIIAGGIAYTVGVLCCMALLGFVLFSIKSAGQAVGWGFQLQSPEMVATLCLLMVLVAMYLLGWFSLPSMLTGADSALSSRAGISGSFFTGMLSVAVATPCTAPFMAPALGAAAAMPPLQGLGVLLALGLGLALPYLIICLWPAARAFLPKPGAWMVRFKELLAFFMLATALWLLWVLGQLAGTDSIILVLVSSVLIGFAIWLSRGSFGVLRRILIVLALLLAAYVGVVMQPAVAPEASAIASDRTIMPGVTQVPYSAEGLAKLREAGTPVFVDATADWCITCKVNERVALSDASVQRLFNERGITLMIADWTMRDSAIAKYLASFGRNGVPLYVWYAPGREGEILPQILTPSRITDALSKDLP